MQVLYQRVSIFNLVSNAVMVVQETHLAAVIVIDERGPGSLFGRPLHAFVSCTLVFVYFGLSRSGEHELLSGDLLAMGIIFTWLRMLYFTRLSRMFGSFTIVLVEMLKRDVTRFIFLLAGILPGFLISLRLMINLSCNMDTMVSEAGLRWLDTWHLLGNMILMMFGVASWDGPLYECLDTPVMTVVVILFLLLTAIVLLNLMIAMFADTYERIQGQAVHQWAMNVAVYMRHKELYVKSLCCISNRYIHIGGGPDGWLYKTEGPYENFFIPKLRGDVDSRPEDEVIDMLDEMWKGIQSHQASVDDMLQTLKQQISSQKIAAANM